MELSQQAYDSIVWGGIYKAKNGFRSLKNLPDVHMDESNCGNQMQNYFVPMYDGERDEVFMVNTYGVQSFAYPVECSNKFEHIVMQKMADDFRNKDNHYRIFSDGRYAYYHCCPKLNDQVLEMFELVADLKDFRQLQSDEHDSQYLPEDVLDGVQLYREHAYPYGLTLIRKDAKKDLFRQLKTVHQELMADGSTAYHYSQNRMLEEIHQDLESDPDLGTDDVLEMLRLVEELKEFQENHARIYRMYMNQYHHHMDPLIQNHENQNLDNQENDK